MLESEKEEYHAVITSCNSDGARLKAMRGHDWDFLRNTGYFREKLHDGNSCMRSTSI